MRRRASLLAHRGHGPWHLDLVIESGARLHTISLARERGRWRARWMPSHRRRYLAYAGPIAGGRGVVMRAWSGTLDVRLISHARRSLIGSLPDGTSIVIAADRVVLPAWLARMAP
jgi:hypothetical protein